jgi:anti-sigma regulatory factor (Ser/Thr protein kinase)
MSGTSISEPGKSFDFLVQGGPAAAAAARRAIREGDGALSDGVREDVLLLVTELVTNAVRHGEIGPHGSVRVAVHQWPERVRVEVLDDGPGFEPLPADLGGTGGGWGLYFVDCVADRWGVAPVPSGTCVWFEIASRDGAGP